MGILDDKKKDEILKTVRSYTREELLEWVEMDKKRMALAELEEDIFHPTVMPQMTIDKLNRIPKSEGVLTPTSKLREKAKVTVDSW